MRVHPRLSFYMLFGKVLIEAYRIYQKSFTEGEGIDTHAHGGSSEYFLYYERVIGELKRVFLFKGSLGKRNIRKLGFCESVGFVVDKVKISVLVLVYAVDNTLQKNLFFGVKLFLFFAFGEKVRGEHTVEAELSIKLLCVFHFGEKS